jgi:hypothetical protein
VRADLGFCRLKKIIMKANELRIGNYLEMLGKVRKIECISNLPARKEMYWLTCENMIDIKIIHFKPIPLTEDWLLRFGFENWGRGSLYANEHEVYDRYVLHNALDGTSNFEVHNVMSMHGDKYYQQYIISCDEDEKIKFGH